jgi:hypothetical protein
MQNSKINKLIRFAFCLTLGCSTSSYKITRERMGLIEIEVTPDRIFAECVDIVDYEGEDDGLGAFGFLIYVRNMDDSVISISQGNVIDKKSCFDRLSVVEKVRSAGKKIFVAGVGSIRNELTQNAKKVLFPNHQTYPPNESSLQFAFIRNEAGLCYDAYAASRPPCPNRWKF